MARPLLNQLHGNNGDLYTLYSRMRCRKSNHTIGRTMLPSYTSYHVGKRSADRGGSRNYFIRPSPENVQDRKVSTVAARLKLSSIYSILTMTYRLVQHILAAHPTVHHDFLRWYALHLQRTKRLQQKKMKKTFAREASTSLLAYNARICCAKKRHCTISHGKFISTVSQAPSCWLSGTLPALPVCYTDPCSINYSHESCRVRATIDNPP